MDFNKLFDPSTTLGAFLISVGASLLVGFIFGKQYEKIKKNFSLMIGSGNRNYQDIKKINKKDK